MLEEMIEEVRQEFQIPPYFPDESLLRYLKEGKHRLDTLNPGRSLETDDTFRSLLKNYVYYAYNHTNGSRITLRLSYPGSWKARCRHEPAGVHKRML